MPVPAERAAMWRQVAYAEVSMVVETAMSRLARAEALAVDVEHPATEAIRQAREALAGAPVVASASHACSRAVAGYASGLSEGISRSRIEVGRCVARTSRS